MLQARRVRMSLSRPETRELENLASSKARAVSPCELSACAPAVSRRAARSGSLAFTASARTYARPASCRVDSPRGPRLASRRAWTRGRSSAAGPDRCSNRPGRRWPRASADASAAVRRRCAMGSSSRQGLAATEGQVERSAFRGAGKARSVELALSAFDPGFGRYRERQQQSGKGDEARSVGHDLPLLRRLRAA